MRRLRVLFGALHLVAVERMIGLALQVLVERRPLAATHRRAAPRHTSDRGVNKRRRACDELVFSSRSHVRHANNPKSSFFLDGIVSQLNGGGDNRDVEDDDNEMCVLPVDSDDELRASQSLLLRQTASFDTALACLPIATPFLAFLSYETVARETRDAIDFFGKRNAWFSADGNAYEIEILAPTINGVVIPTIAIALATLAATTISTLRERQLDVRSHLNAELCEIELLRGVVAGLSDDDFDEAVRDTKPSARALRLLRDYTSRLILEASPAETPQRIQARRIADNELIELSTLLSGVRDAHRRSEPASATAFAIITSLTHHRATRLTEMAATYPAVHYAVIALCAASIVANYLIESDQEVLRFLDAFQLKFLFANLVGVVAGLAALIADLSDLYRGAFRITPVVSQLYPLRQSIAYDLCVKEGTDDV